MDKKLGVIYKIHSINDNIKDIYIGSTSNLLIRISRHKYDCNTVYNKKYNRLLYRFIRENGGWDNWKITPIKIFDIKHDKYLQIKERQYIEHYAPSLNQTIPYRKPNESKEIRKTICICDCGTKYTKNHITHHIKTKKHKLLMNNPLYKISKNSFLL